MSSVFEITLSKVQPMVQLQKLLEQNAGYLKGVVLWGPHQVRVLLLTKKVNWKSSLQHIDPMEEIINRRMATGKYTIALSPSIPSLPWKKEMNLLVDSKSPLGSLLAKYHPKVDNRIYLPVNEILVQ